MTWRVEFLDDEVMAALGAFPFDIRASFERIVTMIESHGIERMREPYVKHLEGPVWEMRMKGRDGIAFAKRTQKTQRREIETALRRAKEVA